MAKRRERMHSYEAVGTLVLGRVEAVRDAATSSAVLRRLRKAVILLLVVAGAGALWVGMDDRFNIYGADVVGAARVSPDAIFQASGLGGLHILWVRPHEVETAILAALPDLASVEVACGWPARCTITVVERQPAMMWDEEGTLSWIDADGVIFPAYGMLSEGWLVRGPLPRDEDGRLDEPMRVALVELWAIGAELPPVLYYVPARGLAYVSERGWRVFLGQGSGMAERLQVLEWLEADLTARHLAPRFVDVRFPDAPYYSMTNDE